MSYSADSIEHFTDLQAPAELDAVGAFPFQRVMLALIVTERRHSHVFRRLTVLKVFIHAKRQESQNRHLPSAKIGNAILGRDCLT